MPKYKCPNCVVGHRCARCRTKRMLAQRRRKQRHRDAGLCLYCSLPALSGKSACATHHNAIYVRDRGKQDGVCYCGQPAESGFATCSVCRKSKRDRWLQVKLDAFDAYGGRVCGCCGIDIVEFLTLDHMDGDGAAHRRKIGRNKIYFWVKENNYPVGFQVLCMNCNFAKGIYGVCPHKSRFISGFAVGSGGSSAREEPIGIILAAF